MNQQWRICFVWQDDGAHAIGLVDYHRERADMASSKTLISRDDVDAGPIDFSDVIEPGLDSGGPISPGEHLARVLDDYGQAARELARRLAVVPHNRVPAILGGDRAITADMALRLARLFGTSAEF